MYSNFAQTFAAQRKTVRFSAYATSRLLNDKVSVYQQIKNTELSSASCSQNVIAISWGSRLYMTWQQFLRHYTIWFAAKVLGVQQLDGVKPFADASDMETYRTPVDLEQLQTAVNAINNIPDVDTLDNMYYDYIKGDDITDMGYYCKDNSPLPIAFKKTLTDNYKEKFNETFNTLVDDDILYKMSPDISGMSWTDPWGYMGGFGLAGFHFEDGLLHFGHHLIDCKFSGGDDIDPIDLQMLEVWQRFSRKTWVCSKQAGTPGVLECNKFLADDMGLVDVGDVLLVSRVFVLDPRGFQDSDVFTVVYQHPGEFMFGNLGHCVSGFGMLSFAWNLVLKDYILDYVKGEKDLARIIRRNAVKYAEQRPLFWDNIETDIRSFIFMGTMMEYVITTRDDVSIIFEVKEMLKGCFRAERLGCLGLKAEFLASDDEYVPVNKNDAQCTMCGISCLFAMYVVKHTGKDAKKRQLRREALCYQCAKMYGGKGIKVISLVSTYMAKKLELM